MKQHLRFVAGLVVGIALGFLVYDAVEYMGEKDTPGPVPEAGTEPGPEAPADPEPRPTPEPAPPAPSVDEARSVPPPADLDAVFAIAQRALERLTALVRSKRSTNDEILLAIEEVASAYRLLRVLDRRVTDRESMVGKVRVRRLEKFWKDAEKQLLKAFELERLEERQSQDGQGDPERFNVREPVNVAAAEALGTTRSDRVSKSLIKALERKVFKRKVDASPELLAASFEALARLGDVDSLEWMVYEFSHSKSSPRAQVDRLVAAHRAMVRFDPENVPGKLRFKIAMECVKTYSGVEAAARQGYEHYAVRFWDRIRCGVLEMLRHFAGTQPDSVVHDFQSVESFRVWIKNHKNPNREPWVDAAR